MINGKRLKIVASLFLAVFVLSFSSAALSVSGIPTLSQNDDFFVFTLESNLNETVTVSVAPIVDGTQSIEFEDTIVDLVNGTAQVVRVNYSAEDFNFDFGKRYSTDMTISGDETIVREIAFESQNYCGNILNDGKLKVYIEDIYVKKGFGEEDDFWYLFDEIEVEVTVENNGRYDLEDVELEWVIYAGDQKIVSDEVRRRDIDEGDEELYVINFKLDSKIKYFEKENAKLFIRAIGEIDSDDSKDGLSSCHYISKEVEVRTRDNFVILDDFRVNGNVLDDFVLDGVFSCGNTISISADAFNIGYRDQDDVVVDFYNNKLGLDKQVDLGDIRSFRSSSVFFEFEIPENAEEGWHDILIEVLDDDGDVFENKEGDRARYRISIKVESCYIEPPVIRAVLESDAIAGEKMVVLATITNPNNKKLTGSIILDGYSSWASLDKIDTNVLNLDAQEVQQIRMEFSVDRKAEGVQTFNMNILSEGEIVASQPISVTLEKSGFNFIDFLVDNKNTILIILVNLILLILIIVVAVKILKRK